MKTIDAIRREFSSIKSQKDIREDKIRKVKLLFRDVQMLEDAVAKDVRITVEHIRTVKGLIKDLMDYIK